MDRLCLATHRDRRAAGHARGRAAVSSGRSPSRVAPGASAGPDKATERSGIDQKKKKKKKKKMKKMKMKEEIVERCKCRIGGVITQQGRVS